MACYKQFYTVLAAPMVEKTTKNSVAYGVALNKGINVTKTLTNGGATFLLAL